MLSYHFTSRTLNLSSIKSPGWKAKGKWSFTQIPPPSETWWDMSCPPTTHGDKSKRSLISGPAQVTWSCYYMKPQCSWLLHVSHHVDSLPTLVVAEAAANCNENSKILVTDVIWSFRVIDLYVGKGTLKSNQFSFQDNTWTPCMTTLSSVCPLHI